MMYEVVLTEWPRAATDLDQIPVASVTVYRGRLFPLDTPRKRLHAPPPDPNIDPTRCNVELLPVPWQT